MRARKVEIKYNETVTEEVTKHKSPTISSKNIKMKHKVRSKTN